jgi:chromosomal replication initiation ATPase DnaA
MMGYRGSHRFIPADGGDAASRRAKRRLARDPRCLDLIRVVAARRRVPLTELLSTKRGVPAAAEARQLAMYLLHVLVGRPQDVVAALLGRERSTVSYACRLMEERRDDPAFEAEIAAIEHRFFPAESADEQAEGSCHAA